MPTNTEMAIQFLKTLFETTERNIYLASLPNVDGDPNEPSERHVVTRDLAVVTGFVGKWDRAGRGVFVCVGTVAGAKRGKDTIVETPAIHLDLDFKGIDADEATIREKLRQARCPVSVQVFSGGGIHVYWRLKEFLPTQENIERAEAVMRQLADIFAADLSCCEVSRLMRLPGTSNTKYLGPDGEVFPRAVLLEFDDGPVWELSDLEDWATDVAPMLVRKAKPAQHVASRRHDPATAPRETNPYLEHAKNNGFNPPLDVEQALADMAFGNIHATQVSVTASLLNAGREVDEVINIVIDATATAAGDLGARWNWTRERQRVQQMCDSWLRKHPRTPTENNSPSSPADNSPKIRQPENKSAENPPPGKIAGNVVDLAVARKPKAEPTPVTKPPKQLKADQHISIGEAVLGVLSDRGEQLMLTDAGSYWYRDGLWSLLTDPVMTARLEREAQTAAVALSVAPNNKLRSEVRKYIVNKASLHRADVPWDMHGQVPTRSGLVDPRTGELTPAAPEHFSTWRIDVNYVPGSACPLWLQMINDALGSYDAAGRALHIALIQEIVGAGLIDNKPKALSQALVFEGGPDTGKSGLVEVCAGLFGGEQNSTTLDQVTNTNATHSLTQFAYRRPWVLHEAFDQSRWTLSGVVKSIITGDVISINVKWGPQITRRFTAPILWATNHPPQFKEATAAITQRITVIRCLRTFDQRKPIGVAALAHAQGYSKPSDLVLATEMEGLLAWAVAGLQRALERGSLLLPDEVLATRKAIRVDSNLVLGFVEECCDVDADTMVSVPDFTAALSSWWLEHKGDDVRRVPSSESVGRALAALADPKIGLGSDLRTNSRRYIAGLKLNDEGMRHWRHAVVSEAYVFAGRKASTSDSGSNPNVPVPVTWTVKATVIAMRAAIQLSQASPVTDGLSDENEHRDGTETGTSPQADDPPF